MAGDFTHLHLHTTYSLLDGAIRLDDLFPKILEHGQKQVAMTDHGNLFGAVDFYRRAKAHGVKPIFGCETYVAATEMGPLAFRVEVSVEFGAPTFPSVRVKVPFTTTVSPLAI